MKRLLRWFFTLVCVISLVVCLAVGVVWVRSYWIEDFWIWYDNANTGLYSNGLRCGMGLIQYSWYDVSALSGANLAPGHYQQKPPNETHFNPQARFSFAGLRFDQSKTIYGGHVVAEMHLAWPFGLTAIAPALWFMLYRRYRRRAGAGLCRVCGYDLRATPGRCPECGTLSASGI